MSVILVKSGKIEVDAVIDACRGLAPRGNLTKAETSGLLGECALELYLHELCGGCNVIVDNRTTLRRYSAVFDVELGRWICGSETDSAIEGLRQLDLSSYLYEALKGGEVWLDLRPALEAYVFIPEDRGWKGFGLPYGSPLAESLKRSVLRVLGENLERYRGLILRSAEEFFEKLLNNVVESCGYVIGFGDSADPARPSIALGHGVVDVLCLRVSKSRYRGELRICVRVAGESPIEVGCVEIPVDATVGEVVGAIAIEVKTSTRERNPDPNSVAEFRRKLEALKKILKVPVDGYLMHVYHDEKRRVVSIDIYRAL